MRMNKNIRFIDIRGCYNYLGAHKSISRIYMVQFVQKEK